MSRTKRTIPPDVVARLKSRGYYDDPMSQDLFFILENDGAKRDLSEKGYGYGYEYEGVRGRKAKKFFKRLEHKNDRRGRNFFEE